PAVALQAEPAPLARAAAPGAVDGDGVTLGHGAHAVTDGVDPSGVLVTQGERHPPRHHAGFEVVHEVQVGVTRPSAPILTTTCPGPGVGLGTSTISGSDFQSINRNAFMTPRFEVGRVQELPVRPSWWSATARPALSGSRNRRTGRLRDCALDRDIERVNNGRRWRVVCLRRKDSLPLPVLDG